MRGYFEVGTFQGDEEFPFLCEDKDFRGIVSLLYRNVVKSGKGRVTPGMAEWAQLGWYELALGAFIRHGCCPAGTPSPKLPVTGNACQPMSAVLDSLVAASDRSSEDLAADFASTVRCYYNAGLAKPYSYKKHPLPHETDVFVKFLARAR